MLGAVVKERKRARGNSYLDGHRRDMPQRSCVACGNKTSKSALIRIVAMPKGTVEVDSAGNLPGRGTYVCKDGHCVERSLRRGRLEYALRRGLSDTEWAGVLSDIELMSVKY